MNKKEDKDVFWPICTVFCFVCITKVQSPHYSGQYG
jgi:hypothetical protein